MINNPRGKTFYSPAQMFAEEEEERQAKARDEEELQMKEGPDNSGTKTDMPGDVQNQEENSKFKLYSFIKDLIFNLKGNNSPDGKDQTTGAKNTFIVPQGWGLNKISSELGVTRKALEKANKDKLHGEGENKYFYEGAKITIPGRSNLNEKGLKQKLNLDEINFDWIINVSSSINDAILYFYNIFNSSKENRYTSQRDNTFDDTDVYTTYTDRVYGDNMCNVTSLTMQLKKLFPSDEKLKSAAIKLLKDKGYSGSEESLHDQQTEDVILRIFKQLGEEYFKKEVGIKPGSGYPPHQYAKGLNHVGAMFSDYVGDTDTKYSVYNKQSYNKELKPELDKGSAILVSTYLTAGHIVYLKAILDDGIVIHDPYGMRLPDRYIKNSSQISKKDKIRIKKYKTVIKRRTKHKNIFNESIDALTANGDKEKFSSRLGESNFYNWKEVKKYSIGRWINILSNNKENQ
jgi:ribosomal protein L33